ncbi:MAG: hypothetical protein K6F53_10045 [Lachnospiraceae bacterium]|nr:hypothetical protein [Lachnospiraceae bacterium]
MRKRRNKTIRKTRTKTGRKCFLPLLTALLACALLGGCGLRKGNDRADVEEAIRFVSEKYNTEFKLKKKDAFPGGAECDITVTTKDLPDKEIRVFRLNDREEVRSDYLFVKYGDDVWKRIRNALSGIVPDAKIVTDDFYYNHFNDGYFDSDPGLEQYLLKNDFRVFVYLTGERDEAELRSLFETCADALLQNGVNCKNLYIYVLDSKESFLALKEYDYIPEHTGYEGIPYDHIKARAESNRENLQTTMDEYDSGDAVYILCK